MTSIHADLILSDTNADIIRQDGTKLASPKRITFDLTISTHAADLGATPASPALATSVVKCSYTELGNGACTLVIPAAFFATGSHESKYFSMRGFPVDVVPPTNIFNTQLSAYIVSKNASSQSTFGYASSFGKLSGSSPIVYYESTPTPAAWTAVSMTLVFNPFTYII